MCVCVFLKHFLDGQKRNDTSPCLIELPRFELAFLQSDLFAWVMSDAVIFEDPIQFQPTRGCQIFMQVNKAFWQNVLGSEPTSTSSSFLLMTLGAEETESIVTGEQKYLLRSQRVPAKQERIHLAVKSLGYCVPGTVEFESIQEFTSLQRFNKWEGLSDCNPNDIITGGSIMKRLQEGKTVFAVKLANPEKFTECLEWVSPVSLPLLSASSFGFDSFVLLAKEFLLVCIYIYIYTTIYRL